MTTPSCQCSGKSPGPMPPGGKVVQPPYPAFASLWLFWTVLSGWGRWKKGRSADGSEDRGEGMSTETFQCFSCWKHPEYLVSGRLRKEAQSYSLAPF